jgi:hypothetical protein
MCDYSIQAIRTRPAKVDDKLTVCMFGWSTRGLAAPEDRSLAVCLSPGTELSFAEEVRKVHSRPWSPPSIRHKTAIFRKVHEHNPTVHHDTLEFPDGRIILLTFLELRQQATVLQLPVPHQDECTSVSETEMAHPLSSNVVSVFTGP